MSRAIMIPPSRRIRLTPRTEKEEYFVVMIFWSENVSDELRLGCADAKRPREYIPGSYKRVLPLIHSVAFESVDREVLGRSQPQQKTPEQMPERQTPIAQPQSATDQLAAVLAG